jgi:hypothetical protein
LVWTNRPVILTSRTTPMQRIFPPHFAARRTIAEGYLLFCSLM